eukprot:16323944-Heterocapsa_arctica.AAC.1
MSGVWIQQQRIQAVVRGKRRNVQQQCGPRHPRIRRCLHKRGSQAAPPHRTAGRRIGPQER